MKIKRSKAGLTLQLGKREAGLFWTVLSRYPSMPLAHFPLSRGKAPQNADDIQELLVESLESERARLRSQLSALMKDPARCINHPKGTDLTLSAPDVEWLLQVLNEVRVGAWVRLGSPENLDGLRDLPEDQAQYAGLMELAGYFQVALLEGTGETP